MLLVGAALMIFAGVVFALTGDYFLLTLAAFSPDSAVRIFAF